MNKLACGLTVCAAVAMFGNSVSAEEAAAEETGPFASSNFTSTVYLTNQYMFRGISNSDGPAIQGSLDWTYSGFFVGVWGSNTEFSDANVEVDYYGGYRWTMAGIGMTLQGLYYSYPGEDKNDFEGFDPIGVDADYGEVNIGASYTFTSQLAPSLGLNYFYSPDTFGEDGSSHTIQGSFGLTLPAGIGLYANVGYNDTEGDKSSGKTGLVAIFDGPVRVSGYDYTYYSVGANYVVKGFKLDLAYHGTDESSTLKQFYADTPAVNDNFRDLIDGYVVFTVSRTF